MANDVSSNRGEEPFAIRLRRSQNLYACSALFVVAEPPSTGCSTTGERVNAEQRTTNRERPAANNESRTATGEQGGEAVKQILDVWFSDHILGRFAQSSRSWASCIATTLLAALILHPLACAQAARTPPRSSESKRKPAPPVIAEVTPTPQPAPPPAPAPPPTPAQMPPSAPEVLFDGKQLSIHAEDSTLFDRARTNRPRCNR